jgi:NAD(P)H-dependent FMN reductase
MDDSGSVVTAARVFNVVGFAGSLRRGSYNRALLRAATELAPPVLRIVIHDLDGIPLYNGDPEVLVARAHEKFDADGRLVHQATRDFLATFLQRSADLTARFTS